MRRQLRPGRPYVPSDYLVPRFPAAVRTVRQRPLQPWFCAAVVVVSFAAGVLVGGGRPAAPGPKVQSEQATLACGVRIETPEQ